MGTPIKYSACTQCQWDERFSMMWWMMKCSHLSYPKWTCRTYSETQELTISRATINGRLTSKGHRTFNSLVPSLPENLHGRTFMRAFMVVFLSSSSSELLRDLPSLKSSLTGPVFPVMSSDLASSVDFFRILENSSFCVGVKSKYSRVLLTLMIRFLMHVFLLAKLWINNIKFINISYVTGYVQNVQHTASC